LGFGVPLDKKSLARQHRQAVNKQFARQTHVAPVRRIGAVPEEVFNVFGGLDRFSPVW
jgi:hypothetical protein